MLTICLLFFFLFISFPVSSNRFKLDSTRSTPSPPPSSPSASKEVSLPVQVPIKHHRTLRSATVLQQSPKPDSYSASASSGNQTEGVDGADEDSTDSEGTVLNRSKFRTFDIGVLEGFGRGKRKPLVTNTRRLSPLPMSSEGGRGEYVLVGKNGLSTADSGSERTLSWDGIRGGNWGTSIFDALDGNSNKPIRRPSSTLRALSSGNGSRGSKNRASRTPEPIVREPSPPLSFNSINSSFNPFPLFHIRWDLISEIVLILGPFLFALYRLSTVTSSLTFPNISALPIHSLLLLSFTIPFIAIFRRSTSYFKVPFTDERGYRDPLAADDGVTIAILLPLLFAIACYWDTYSSKKSGLDRIQSLTELWESSGVHALTKSLSTSTLIDPRIYSQPIEMARALLVARYELVLLSTLNSIILLFNLALSRTLLSIEKLPTNNTKRFFGSMGVSAGISLAVYSAALFYDRSSLGPLSISPIEAGITTFIQQTSFYIVSRLARRGFTLGELSTMTGAGNALCLEFWRLSRSRWLYKRGYPGVPLTFRSPTPILVFQAVLIAGAFLTGFLLSPLLVISRHIAQKPSHRIKWPIERERQRRLLALGVFVGLIFIIFFGLGGWAGWMLGGGLLQAWKWALDLVFYGAHFSTINISISELEEVQMHWWTRWKRLGLVMYWAGTIVIAVGGWQTRLVRARRIRINSVKLSPGSGYVSGNSSSGAIGGGGTSKSSNLIGAEKTLFASTVGGLKLIAGNVSNVASGSEGKGRVSEVLNKVGAEDAREEKRVHASLNMRRKFFHALAVTMFVPGIAIDPSFTSLAFSVAFALFTFCEYARYFALYPIGAPLHIFFSEFIDSKDSGPVILSHFYLLTGCAGGLWLEGRGINRYSGVLVLGVGDALASIIGKLIGRIRWPGTSKTVEGTLAFILSIVGSAWFLRSIGWAEPFSLYRYTIAATLAALFEATSKQNDNLVIPIYLWSLIALFDV